jgi:hypothetical protein
MMVNLHFLLRECDVSPLDPSTQHYSEVLDDVPNIFYIAEQGQYEMYVCAW